MKNVKNSSKSHDFRLSFVIYVNKGNLSLYKNKNKT
jgi:hypothetical protein